MGTTKVWDFVVTEDRGFAAERWPLDFRRKMTVLASPPCPEIRLQSPHTIRVLPLVGRGAFRSTFSNTGWPPAAAMRWLEFQAIGCELFGEFPPLFGALSIPHGIAPPCFGTLMDQPPPVFLLKWVRRVDLVRLIRRSDLGWSLCENLARLLDLLYAYYCYQA